MARRASRLATVAQRAHEAACFLWVATLPVAVAPESLAFFVLMVTSAARIVVDPDARGSFLGAVRVLLPLVLVPIAAAILAALAVVLLALFVLGALGALLRDRR